MYTCKDNLTPLLYSGKKKKKEGLMQFQEFTYVMIVEFKFKADPIAFCSLLPGGF